MDSTMKADMEVFLNQLARFESPSDAEEEESIKAVLGNTPSLAMLENVVRFYTKRYERILREDLPAVLEEHGAKQVVIDGGYYDGATVRPERVIQTKTLNKEEMVTWLEEVGASDIVKDAISLGKGGFDEALSAFLLEHDYAYTYEAKVEGQSLKKVITDIISDREKGGETPLPPESAVHIDQFTVAKIVMPKKDKEM